jgi:hypothetical protein
MLGHKLYLISLYVNPALQWTEMIGWKIWQRDKMAGQGRLNFHTDSSAP